MGINLKKKVINQILKSEKISNRLILTIENTKLNNINEKKGKLLHDLISKTIDTKIYPQNYINFCTEYIRDDKIISKIQIDEIVDFFKKNLNYNLNDENNINYFNKEIGVGITYTQNEIDEYIDNFIKENMI